MLLQASNASMAKLLLEQGADATALMFAAQGGHEAVAKLLLQHAAEVRAAMHSNARWQDSTDDC